MDLALLLVKDVRNAATAVNDEMDRKFIRLDAPTGTQIRGIDFAKPVGARVPVCGKSRSHDLSLL